MASDLINAKIPAVPHDPRLVVLVGADLVVERTDCIRQLTVRLKKLPQMLGAPLLAVRPLSVYAG